MKQLNLLPYFSILLVCAVTLGCKKPNLPEPTPPTAALKISIVPEAVTLRADQPAVGSQLTVKIENLPAGAPNKVSWKSEQPNIARVTDEGMVFPMGPGQTTVTATLAGGKATASAKITVTDANEYKYRLVLKDKGTSSFTLAQPDKYLSAKAIQRRLKRNIAIDETDLPISPAYLEAIQKVGGKIVVKSKWLNTVSVHTDNKFLIDQYRALPFVKDVIMVWEGKSTSLPAQKYVDVPQLVSNHTSQQVFDYGSARTNITVNNGQVLHEQGFKGAGMDIAVMDAGFINLKQNPAFKNVNIKGAKSFVYEDDNPYNTDTHGVMVTSTMAVNLPGKYVGTAPEANYWLFRTEDDASEYPIEEDYWVAAAEYADSAGVDIINTSLSYTTGYGFVSARYRYEDMDGKTAFASRGANVAAAKGIFMVASAGNEATWIGTPAESPNVLALGSVTANLTISGFSSFGITVDGRIKPDVLALGSGSSVINTGGNSESRNGTSFSSPIMCGLVACLWQAYPKLTNKELLQIMRMAGDRANNPGGAYGYGVANMQKAMDLSSALSATR